MAILIDENTRVIVQGITGTAGRAHTKTMLQFGTNIVAGVKPGSEGEKVENVPVYSTVEEAMREGKANASIIFVPAKFAKAAAIEAINAGIKLLVLPPEHIPIHDTMYVLELANRMGTKIIGPNTAGIIAPGIRCKIGFVPNKYYIDGHVGVASRSGTLLYEFGSRLTLEGLGQSTCIGVGGDPIVGTRIGNVLQMFEHDPKTKVSLIIGEIGGTQEEEVADLIASGLIKKPVVAYIVGRSVPAGKRMGHAGAIMYGEKGTMESKIKALSKAGVNIAGTMQDTVDIVKNLIG
ncbi:MAG: succinate--CoA ligase subunit alpha [Candidatus Micrarchaeaceae archaeon]